LADGGQVRHSPVNFGDLFKDALFQVRCWEPVPAGVEQLDDFVEREPEPLRGLDDADERDRVRRVRAVPAGAAGRFGDQATVTCTQVPSSSLRSGDPRHAGRP
jgi:hypothetical protein